MNQNFRSALLICGALFLGFVFEVVAYGQTVVYSYGPQPVYCGTEVQPTEGYLRLNGYAGGVMVQAEYGCNQRVTVVQGGRPYSLETNRPEQGFNYALEVDRRANCDVSQAMDLARKVAPVMVTGNPCPQQCSTPVPIRRICGRIIGYSQAPRAAPCATSAPYCATPAPFSTGSCCSGGDGRNPMIAYPPGDPHGVCHCAQNANGPGRSCACPPNCTQCNPTQIAGYVGYGR